MELIIDSILFDNRKAFELESILFNLSRLYANNSLGDFNYNFDNLFSEYKDFIEQSIQIDIEQYGEKEQDLIEFAVEIYYLRNPIKIDKPAVNKSLTLRNSEDVEEFEAFLDRMLKLDALSHDEFLRLFPQCPTEYYDKIDDLRETSKKSQRDSEAFTRCLDKAKVISMSYSNGI